jgi:histidinol-phosphate aminotransferase
MKSMKTFWSTCIRSLEPYRPGEQPPIGQMIKLNTNENPYPPSPAVIDALRRTANDSLRLYPDPEGKVLKKTIADIYDLTQNNVFLGNGSDEVLAHTFFGLLQHEMPILFPDVTYSFYPVYCALYGIKYQTVPLAEDFQISVGDYAQPNGGIVLANPNAPTGSAISIEQLRCLIDHSQGSVVVVDEAYVDFGAESAIQLVKEFPNVLVVQTLSKSRSLAGLRVGFAIGDAGLIEALNLVKNCFNSYPLDRLALAGAEAALRDKKYFELTRQQIIKSRDLLAKELIALGFYVVPSKANFLFVRHGSIAASEIQQQLRQRKIVVRHFPQPRIIDFLRISIGTPEECTELVRVLREILL